MPKSDTKLKHQNYYMGEGQIATLSEISVATRLSVAEHVRRAVDLYITHYHAQKAKGLVATVGPIVGTPEPPVGNSVRLP